MKNLGALIHSYAADHDGYFPDATASIALNWDNRLVNEGYIGSLKDTRKTCPTTRSRIDATVGFNYKQLGNTEPGGVGLVRMARVEKPSQTIMLTDAHALPFNNDVNTGWPCVVYWDDRFWPDGEFTPIGHRGGVNVVWVDGHASWMKTADAWLVKDGDYWNFQAVKPPSP